MAKNTTNTNQQPLADLKESGGSSPSLSELKALRSTTKGSLTRIRQLVQAKKDTLSLTELQCRLGILESYFKQIIDTQIQIERLSSETEMESNSRSRNEIEDLYIETKSELMSLMAKEQTTISPESFNASFSVSQLLPRSKLQSQKIPKFSGKYSEYPNFIGIFKKLVHNNLNLDNYERFNYLLDSLEGAALASVKEFEVNNLNYHKAINRLQERFDNKNLMLEEHIKSLFSLSKVHKGASTELRSLVDNVNTHYSAMQSIGTFENIANALIIHVVCERLDTDSLVKWEESIDYSKLNSWQQCEGVLSRRCQNLEVREAKSLSSSSTSQTAAKDNHRKSRSKKTLNNTNTSLVAAHSGCQYCNKNGHSIDKCSAFQNLSIADRFSEVKKRMLCINCLGTGHSVKKCTSSKCQVCGWPHNMLLHRYVQKPTKDGRLLAEPEVANPVNTSLHSSVTDVNAAKESCQVILATAVVKLRDNRGQFHDVRALLDSASQLNFVTEAAVQRLHLKKTRVNAIVAGVGEKNVDVKCSTNIFIKSRLTSFETSAEALILPKITSVQPEEAFDIDSWKIPRNLQMADPYFNLPSSVDILIGADLFFDLLSVGQIKLDDDQPTLQKTVFGWVVSGRVKATRLCSSSCHVVADNPSSDSHLADIVERFWQIETFQSSKPLMTAEEILCENHFISTVQRNKTGRFVVRLPFKEEKTQLGDSLRCAQKRFWGLERRLMRDPSLKRQYAAFIQEYLDLGHMVKVPKSQHSFVKYITPHQCVIRPDSTTTKLRVVFDCSSRTSSNLSLNDTMLKGPVVQDELFAIVLRFRCYKFALTADIAKMYRQILVDEKDTFYQCILWRDHPDEDLDIYRLLTVTYGTTSAPYLATRCLTYLSEQYHQEYPVGAQKLRDDFYVDDFISGANTIDEIERIYDEVRKILELGKFEIRKWFSNEPAFLARIPEDEKEKPLRINDADIIKALGIVWDPKSDEFCCLNPNIATSPQITMRSVLSEMSQLFDPLGLISPIIVKAKVFLQDLWISKVSWDESLSQDLHTQWRTFKDQLPDLKKIRMERCVLPTGNFQIHGFADASKRAYGCCVYIRSVVDGIVVVRLLVAKSRVAPRKVQPIPRLELCAAELLVQLIQKVVENVPKRVETVTLWTDSEIVLHWLAKHPSSWETFVANRVSRIQQGSHQATWRHVGSKSNPADIVSRGTTVDELLKSFWFKGPPFLYKDEESWPKTKLNLNEPKELNITKVSLLNVKTNTEFENIFTKFKDFQKTLRIFTYVRRFIVGWFAPNLMNKGPIETRELHGTFMNLIWKIQQNSFQTEIKELQRNKEISKQSNLKALSPFLSKEGDFEIKLLNKNKETLKQNKWKVLSQFLGKEGDFELLRVGGRLKNANLEYGTKHPILLPSNSIFVWNYVEYLHKKNLHAGAQSLVALIRQKFWIIGCRKLTLNVVKKCILCFKYIPRLQGEIMGNLPKDRVELTRPFLVSGVDFCGPHYITEGVRSRPPRKVYVAVFVCFGCKAVHLEMVGDLTTKSFIAALKRFVARRGIPQRIYCDNATNFVGTRRELEELKNEFFKQQTKDEIQAWCTAEGLEFKHIPPRAPHFGGLWEAAVKSFKFHFRRVSSKTILNFEEFNTLIVEIESVLNSRPIAVTSSDPNDLEALTPGHFLIGTSQRAIPEPIIEEPRAISAIERWKRVNLLRQHFWERWQKEYLLEMQSKSKWRKGAPKSLQVDMLVLIHDDNTPPNQWNMGRIVKLIPGGDGKIRVVDVRTKSGIIRRAVQRLAILPCQN